MLVSVGGGQHCEIELQEQLSGCGSEWLLHAYTVMSEKYYTYLIGSKPIGGNLLNFT